MYPPSSATQPEQRSWTIAHDFMYSVGGAERVTATVARDVLPHAPVRCLGYLDEVTSRLGISDRVQPGPGLLSRLATPYNYRALSLALSPTLSCAKPVEGNLFASSYAFSHHLRATGRVVVYCHSPLRQAWSGVQGYSAALPLVARGVFEGAVSALRALDLRAVGRVNHFISSGPVVSDRIRRYYGREPNLELPPPVDVQVFRPAGPVGDYYLWAGRIVEPYKRVGLLVETFAKNGRKLIIAGDGRDRARLESVAPPNVSFVGAVGTEELVRLMAGARAFLFPSLDDFGMAPVEAMACGAPVIAFGGGGALGTVLDGETGVFFNEAESTVLQRAIERHDRMDWDRQQIREHVVRRFSSDRFVAQLRSFLSASQ